MDYTFDPWLEALGTNWFEDEPLLPQLPAFASELIGGCGERMLEEVDGSPPGSSFRDMRPRAQRSPAAEFHVSIPTKGPDHGRVPSRPTSHRRAAHR